MSSDTTTPSAQDITQARRWLGRWADVAVGDLPGSDELLSGMVPFRGSWKADIQEWAAAVLSADNLPKKIRAGLERLSTAEPSAGSLLDVHERADRWARETADNVAIDVAERTFIYLCARGQAPAERALAMLSGAWRGGVGYELRFAWLIGANLHGQGDFLDPGELVQRGLQRIEHAAAATERTVKAIDIVRAGERPSDDEPVGPSEEVIHAMLEDRGEIVTTPLAQLKPPPPPAAVVMPAKPAEPSRATKDAWKSFESLAGKRILLARRPDVVAARLALQRRFPYAAEAILTLLRDLMATDVVRLRPTLFVGPPGAGKSSLAIAIGRALGIGATIYPAAGSTDSSIMGTSAQWSSARPCVPLQAIQQARLANPLVIVDEIEKVSLDRRNGSLADALLAMLERTTSRAYRDLSLEADVDLSHVNWIATANELTEVPGPLRDRFRVVQVNEPGWEHVGDLARNILDDIAAERGLDRRWIEDLAADELEVLRTAWDGGSIRKLRRALEVLVDGRDAIMGRA
ncbi:AAA family ATPase [Chelatococcus sambhunathii]|uniref:AAA family ATPase n=1 Tax=Chelatococcus sambhunathii TaxID=363953 RepID=A0ABU1DCW0_9HYPH|nr:AAA family ATPase [Chelatococcus sambhunathii]MDR4305954.1 AAA family ATPase [Chelatococcus sambhunathii]